MRMIWPATLFFLGAGLMALIGFGGVAEPAETLGQAAFFVCVVLGVTSLVAGLACAGMGPRGQPAREDRPC